MQNGYIESFNGRFRDECLNDSGNTVPRNFPNPSRHRLGKRFIPTMFMFRRRCS